jgi:O-acetyl-ADP-ribose deacetylase (regulator of RNase III)
MGEAVVPLSSFHFRKQEERMNQSERRQYLIRSLLKEDRRYREIQVPSGAEEQKQLLRGLMNIRAPKAIDGEFLEIQDAYLQEETKEKGIVELDDLTPVRDGIYLWQGDITTLRCDAIVNAANSGMTGCYVPNHRCIDNCIHSYSGIQLRLFCEEMMEEQGFEEPTGQAKITPAYNLPCRYVLHTVGPIITGRLTERDCELLSSCYRSCLLLAAEKGLESVAFCCISTGEFHFPNERAAEIAVHEVEAFLKQDTSVKKVIFNVFKDLDKEIYQRLL